MLKPIENISQWKYSSIGEVRTLERLNQDTTHPSTLSEFCDELRDRWSVSYAEKILITTGIGFIGEMGWRLGSRFSPATGLASILIPTLCDEGISSAITSQWRDDQNFTLEFAENLFARVLVRGALACLAPRLPGYAALIIGMTATSMFTQMIDDAITHKSTLQFDSANEFFYGTLLRAVDTSVTLGAGNLRNNLPHLYQKQFEIRQKAFALTAIFAPTAAFASTGVESGSTLLAALGVLGTYSLLAGPSRKTPAHIVDSLEKFPLIREVAKTVEPFLGDRRGQTFTSQVQFHPDSIYSRTTLDDLPSVRDFQKNVLAELKEAKAGELCLPEPVRNYFIWLIEQGVPDQVLAHALFMGTIEDLAYRCPDSSTRLEVIDIEAKIDNARPGENYLNQFLYRIKTALNLFSYKDLAKQAAQLTVKDSQLKAALGRGYWGATHFKDSETIFKETISFWTKKQIDHGDTLHTITIPSILMDHVTIQEINSSRKAPFLFAYGPDGHLPEKEYNLALMHGNLPVTPFLKFCIVEKYDPALLHPVIATRHDSEFHGDQHINQVPLLHDAAVGIVGDQLTRNLPQPLAEKIWTELYVFNDRFMGKELLTMYPCFDDWWGIVYKPIVAHVGNIIVRYKTTESDVTRYRESLTGISNELTLLANQYRVDISSLDDDMQELKKIGSN